MARHRNRSRVRPFGVKNVATRGDQGVCFVFFEQLAWITLSTGQWNGISRSRMQSATTNSAFPAESPPPPPRDCTRRLRETVCVCVSSQNAPGAEAVLKYSSLRSRGLFRLPCQEGEHVDSGVTCSILTMWSASTDTPPTGVGFFRFFFFFLSSCFFLYTTLLWSWFGLMECRVHAIDGRGSGRVSDGLRSVFFFFVPAKQLFFRIAPLKFRVLHVFFFLRCDGTRSAWTSKQQFPHLPVRILSSKDPGR